MSNNTSKVGFRLDLQGLRALAVLVVVLSHAGVAGFAGGYVGVDLFFVLSGYLITGALYIEYSNKKSINLLGFYSRRLKRLLPALLVMLLVTLVVAFAIFGDQVKQQIASAPYVAVWLSNLYFSFRETGYFDELSLSDFYLHTWSLGVEEQFYLVWPLLLIVLSRIPRFGPGSGPGSGAGSVEGSVSRSQLAFGFSVLVIASFGLNLLWSSSQPIWAFYQMPSRAWQFGIGALVFLKFGALHQDKPIEGSRVWGYLLLVGGVALVAASVVLFDEQMTYPGWAALAPSIGAACVIVAGHFLPDRKNFLVLKPLTWLGDRSYSVYLWHWPFLIFLQTLVGALTGTMVLMVVLLTLLVADLSYRFIERPFWKGSLSQFAPRKVIQVGVLSMLVGVLVGFHSARNPIEDEQLVGADTSSQWRMDVPEIYRMPCDSWYHSDEAKPCVFGNEHADNTVVFWGDSIGAQWFSLIALAFDARDWRLVVFTKSACPIVDVSFFYERIKQQYVVCEQWRENVLSRLNDWKPDLVIVGSASSYGFSDDEWMSGSQRLWERVLETSEKIVVIPGTPALGVDGPSCVTRHLESGSTDFSNACRSDQSGAVQHKVADLLRRAAQGVNNVEVMDLNEHVCPSGICRAVSDDGLVVYRDSQHLTDTFVRSILPKVGQTLRSYAN